MKRLAVLVALALALAALTPSLAGDEPEKALTVMIYMCGSNLESQYGSAYADIEEIRDSGVDAQAVNVLLLTGGSAYWHTGQDADTVELRALKHSRRSGENRWATEATLPARSMGQAQTLSDFLEWGVMNYPAQRYALILWDHGGGPMNGVCFDELYAQDDNPDSLVLGELRDALADSPFGAGRTLEWIGFDACLMSSVETAFTCAPFARYMIASQETEPGKGWDYRFLAHAAGCPDGGEMGKRIVGAYMDGADDADLMLTLACVDLSRLADVEAAMDDLFVDLGGRLDPAHFSGISNGRRDAKSFGRASTGSEYDLVDLYSLSEQYAAAAPRRSAALRDALDAAVVCQAGNQPNSHGLSVYYPYYNKAYYRTPWGTQYARWGFADGYRDFMRDYARLWLGEQLADWSGVEATALQASPDSQQIILPLTQAQADNFAFAQLYIVGRMDVAHPYYYKVDEIDDVALDADGVLHADYDYRALYAVDGQGNPLCDAIPYRIVDGYYLIRANLTDKTWAQYWDESLSGRRDKDEAGVSLNARKVYLQCLPNAAGDGLDVVGVIDMRDHLGEGISGLLVEGEGLYTGKQSITMDMDEWNWVWFFHHPRQLTRDADGGLLAFDEWPDPNEDGSDRFAAAFKEIDNKKPWSLKFLRQQSSGSDLYAQYILHDTQGNLTGSNLIPVANPNLVRSTAMNAVAHESDDFTLTLRRLDVVKAQFNDGLFLRFHLDDRRQAPGDVEIDVENVALNRCWLGKRYSLTAVPAPEGGVEYVLNLPTKDMPQMLEDTLERISFDASIRDPAAKGDIERFTVALSEDVDISAVHAGDPDRAMLATAQVGDMAYGLMDIAEAEDCLTLRLFAENRGEAAVAGGWRASATVNGCEWHRAVDAAWFDLPAGDWTVVDCKLYKVSLPENAIWNYGDIPMYSFAERWGIDAIRRLEFVDWNDEVVRFDLDSPFALAPADTAARAPEGRFVEALPILDTPDMAVSLAGFSVQDGALRCVVDITNRTGAAMSVLPIETSVNGVPREADLHPLDVRATMKLSGMTVPAGRRKRLVCAVELGGLDASARLETFALGFEYRPEGAPVWLLCAPATLAVSDGPALGEGAFGLGGTDDLALLSPGALLEDNGVLDPAALIRVDWNAPGDPSDYAVTLSATLTDAQAREFESARVVLMRPWRPPEGYEASGPEGMSYITVMQAGGPDGNNRISCDFNGLLIGAEGVDMPFAQILSPSGDGWSYDVKALKLVTDHANLWEQDVWIEALNVGVRPGDRLATVDGIELSRTVGNTEKKRHLECMTTVYTYADGPGSTLQDTDKLVGEELELGEGPIRLCVRPAADCDPLVVFWIINRDGSRYTIQKSYGEAAGR